MLEKIAIVGLMLGTPSLIEVPDKPDSKYVVGKFSSEESWANVSLSDSITDVSLDRVESAASRAAVRAPVLEVCEKDSTKASGARRIRIKEEIYYPLAQGTFSLSSGYGYRIHPILGTVKKHDGVDYVSPHGTSIYSVAAGVVVEAKPYDGSRGNYTKIKHEIEGKTWYSGYLHQSSLGVSVGQKVGAGEYIGAVGNTGRSTGAHLHLEIEDSGEDHVDPSQWLNSHSASFIGETC